MITIGDAVCYWLSILSLKMDLFLGRGLYACRSVYAEAKT